MFFNNYKLAESHQHGENELNFQLEVFMKFFKFVSVLLLCMAAVLPLAAGGGQQGRTQPAGNSAAIVSSPGQLPIVREPVTLSLGIQTFPNVTDYQNNYLTRYAEQKTGIKIDFHFFNLNELAMQFQLMVSANEKLPDILVGGDSAARTLPWADLGDQGVFIDLAPYYERQAYFYNEKMKEISQYERDLIRLQTISASGKRYAWPQYEANSINYFWGKNYINKTWLDKLGLKVPTTTEEFYNVLVAFRDRDPNGNGQKDEIPWLGGLVTNAQEALAFIINAFVFYEYRPANESLLNATNGKLWTPWTTEEYREALRFMNRLMNEGLASPSIFSITSPELIPLCSYQPGEPARIGVVSAHPSTVFLPETPAVYEYQTLASLTGPKGVNNYPKEPPVVSAYSFITKDCANPEAAFRWLDFFWEKDAAMVSRFGEKDVDWRWVNPNEGKLSCVGLPALMEEINPLWNLSTNKHWNDKVGSGLFVSTDMKIKEEGTWNGARYDLYQDQNINDGKDAAEKVRRILYTREEEDSIREIRNSINTYREECLALFCTGAMSLDRDWNTYLGQLDRMGLQRYLETAQRAYTRQTTGR